MTRFFNADAYTEKLLEALEAQNWNLLDNARVAIKRRLLECLSTGEGADEVEKCREALFRTHKILQLSKLRHLREAQDRCRLFLADAEMAAIALEIMPLPEKVYTNAKQNVLSSLAEERIGERTLKTTSELVQEAGLSAEIICKSLGRLRAEKRIVTRRIGKGVYHRLAEPSEKCAL